MRRCTVDRLVFRTTDYPRSTSSSPHLINRSSTRHTLYGLTSCYGFLTWCAARLHEGAQNINTYLLLFIYFFLLCVWFQQFGCVLLVFIHAVAVAVPSAVANFISTSHCTNRCTTRTLEKSQPFFIKELHLPSRVCADPL